jgi:hypothetical protein
MSVSVSAAALSSTIASPQPTPSGSSDAAGAFDDILKSVTPSVEENPIVANLVQTGGTQPSPFDQFPANTLTPEKLNDMAREMKVQADTRSVANMALHKVLDGIQDTARTLTRQS